MAGRLKLIGNVMSAIGLSCGWSVVSASTEAQSSDAQSAPVEQQATDSDAVASAQTGGLQEIVVTAQRRSENLQRAAISVTALNPEQLSNASVTSAADLTALVPSLQGSNESGYTVFYVRGIGSGAFNAFTEPAVALNLNGVYISRPNAVNGQFFDVERVEVLNGPQGTLYGRNATGGAVNLLSRTPELGSSSGYVSVEYGNYNELLTTGALNLPLNESNALRFAFQTENHEGYNRDGTDDADTKSLRLSSLSELTPDLTVKLVGDYSQLGGRGGGAALLPLGSTPIRGGLGDPAAVAVYQNAAANTFIFPGAIVPVPVDQARLDTKAGGILADIEIRTAAGTLTILPAYREMTADNFSTTTGFFVIERIDQHQTSFEVRLASDSAQRLRYLFGAYYFKEVAGTLVEPDASFIGVVEADGHAATETAAGFSQLTFAVTDSVRLTGGLRYTWEDKSLSGTQTIAPPAVLTSGPGLNPLVLAPTAPSIITDASRTFYSTTWKGGIEWDAGPNSLVYANVGTGFKAGGFFFAQTNSSYDPEKVISYELGTKNRFFDNKVQLNVEAFDYKYKDQQLAHIGFVEGLTGPVTGFPTENIGRSTIYGAEVEAQYLPTDSVLLGLQTDYVHSRYDSFIYSVPDFSSAVGLPAGSVPAATGCPTSLAGGSYTINCSGRQLLESPTWTISGNIQKTFDLANNASIVAEVRSRYESGRWISDSFLPVTRVGGDTTTDATLTFHAPGKRWSATGYVNNLANKEVAGYAFPHETYPIFPSVAATLRPPRTYGIRGQYNF